MPKRVVTDSNSLKERTGGGISGQHLLFDNQLLTYKQAAQYLSVCESYLRRLKRKGLIPFVLVSDRGVRFRVSSLNQWVEEREVK